MSCDSLPEGSGAFTSEAYAKLGHKPATRLAETKSFTSLDPRMSTPLHNVYRRYVGIVAFFQPICRTYIADMTFPPRQSFQTRPHAYLL